jgi:hypothetical protein
VRSTRPVELLFPYLGGGAKGLKSVSSASLRPTASGTRFADEGVGTNFSLYPESSEAARYQELNGTVVKVKDGACVERMRRSSSSRRRRCAIWFRRRVRQGAGP